MCDDSHRLHARPAGGQCVLDAIGHWLSVLTILWLFLALSKRRWWCCSPVAHEPPPDPGNTARICWLNDCGGDSIDDRGVRVLCGQSRRSEVWNKSPS
jgi:hypothetical protein